MILQLAQKHFMLQHMQTLQSAMDKEMRLQQQSDTEALERRDRTGITATDLQFAREKLANAHSAVQNAPERDAVFLPDDAVTSVTQSILEFFILNYRSDLIAHQNAAAHSVVPFTTAVLRNGNKPVEDLFTCLRPPEAGWLCCLLADALRKAARPPRPLPSGPAPLNSIGNTARVVLLADWGTGVPRAQEIAKSARRCVEHAARQGRDVHVVHMGNVYYSGQRFEYEQRFLEYWPVLRGEEEKFASYCMNGDHDMYSGGYDYFDYLLADKRFRRQQQSSFFGLQNDFWQILALDTAYGNSQSQWVANARHGAMHKRGILLSHREPFTSSQSAPSDLWNALKPVLDEKLILGWWWGHEHRCLFYEPRPELWYGRCIGNSGVPVSPQTAASVPGVSYRYDAVVPGTNPPVLRLGFAVMDFNRDKLHVQYLGENGVPHADDYIEAAAAAPATFVTHG